MLGIIVLLAVLGVLFWGWQRIQAVLPIAEPFKTIIYVIVMCVVAIWLIYALADLAGGLVHLPKLR